MLETHRKNAGNFIDFKGFPWKMTSPNSDVLGSNLRVLWLIRRDIVTINSLCLIMANNTLYGDLIAVLHGATVAKVPNSFRSIRVIGLITINLITKHVIVNHNDMALG